MNHPMWVRTYRSRDL